MTSHLASTNAISNLHLQSWLPAKHTTLLLHRRLLTPTPPNPPKPPVPPDPPPNPYPRSTTGSSLLIHSEFTFDQNHHRPRPRIKDLNRPFTSQDLKCHILFVQEEITTTAALPGYQNLRPPASHRYGNWRCFLVSGGSGIDLCHKNCLSHGEELLLCFPRREDVSPVKQLGQHQDYLSLGLGPLVLCKTLKMVVIQGPPDLNGRKTWISKSLQQEVFAQGSDTHRFVSSAITVETLAFQTALIAASTLDIQHRTVFLDSLDLVTLLNNGVTNELRSVLYDIRCLTETFSFIFIVRTAIVLADCLAKFALCSLDFATGSV